MKKYYYKIKNTYIKFWKNANNKFYDLELYDDKFNRFYNGKIKFLYYNQPERKIYDRKKT